jgi:hypothetical protein
MHWSFSRLKDYETCPLRYLEVKVLNNYQEEVHPTTSWGTKGHLALEERIRDGKALPSEFSYLESLAQGIGNIPGKVYCELELACTTTRAPTAFSADDAWARGIVDVFVFRDNEAIVVDYKFGKIKPTSQLKLMALLVFANFPTVKRVKTRFLWIAHGDKTDGEYFRSDVDALWKEFEMGAAQLQQAHELGIFKPKPSGLCAPSKSGYKGCIVKTCEYCGVGNKRRW